MVNSFGKIGPPIFIIPSSYKKKTKNLSNPLSSGGQNWKSTILLFSSDTRAMHLFESIEKKPNVELENKTP